MFTEDSDPIKDMHIGYIDGCRHILKKMNGIVLTKEQSEQDRKLFHDPDIWKQPGIKTAADFDWLEPWLLNKICAASIVIALFDDDFVIHKNILFYRTRDYRGNITELYDIVTYWYKKKRKYRNSKKWRTIETGEHVYV